LSTIEEGARAILNLATSPAVERHTGLYFNGLHEAKAQAQAYDPDARRQLEALRCHRPGATAASDRPVVRHVGRRFCALPQQ
jgi:hypothetical protein